jgi:hypothetical protein
MISKHEIKAASITQDNEQKCHGHDHSSRRARRNADKKRRQYLGKELREECNELGLILHR